MRVPVYQTVDGRLWLGCNGFQKEPIDYFEIDGFDKYAVTVVKRINDAFIECEVILDGLVYGMKMTSETFFDLAVQNYFNSGTFSVPLVFECRNPQYLLIPKE